MGYWNGLSGQHYSITPFVAVRRHSMMSIRHCTYCVLTGAAILKLKSHLLRDRVTIAIVTMWNPIDAVIGTLTRSGGERKAQLVNKRRTICLQQRLKK
jgi:hypothetical protein